MKNVTLETNNAPEPAGLYDTWNPSIGYIGQNIVRTNSQEDLIHICRNYVLAYMKAAADRRVIGWCVPQEKQANALALIRRVEYIFNIRPYTESRVSTKNKGTLILKLNPYWVENPMRASFLLFIMRCHEAYTGNLKEIMVRFKKEYYKSNGGVTEDIPSKLKLLYEARTLLPLDGSFTWDKCRDNYEGAKGFMNSSVKENKLVVT